ncbi:MAG: nuclear transport factor 2 family protein [Mojavia pulchra JT2-VF2]|jgi:alkylhydroperoxidase/carboxymuconolactone decarboxylase family protein YurZ/ketosteroid isomerase-like protein/catechol 2,3-dioxygenase-like lactoylglutathione lyase family enzyme|uniref:Nuclear transport factor 2 family protein n=1 Tax=Mojavia pulchra JT2-VF2 TaxID=287848 RepID=A0A951PXR4_9NOST|nr:nuclear transport factor 2 family protein [Mojavia pulchra JT2-VF2]
MTQEIAHKNAVLDDQELQKNLKQINPKFGDFVIRVAGEAWGLPLIDQKTKALITIAIDVVNQDHRGSGNPFAAHVKMALKQGATRDEIEELLLFLCVYAGFNKVAACFGTLNQIFDDFNCTPRTAAMISAIPDSKQVDYSARDRKGKVAFYVLLWKREGISLELFDSYWKDVHGPVCARLPGQYQYWQFHVAHNEGGLWPEIAGLDYKWDTEDNFDGIAELTFESEADRETWFKASAILMDDEHNLFRKAIGYNTSPGNSITYVDRIPTGDPNGEVGAIKFHVLVKKADGVSDEAFRRYLTETFAPVFSSSDSLLKLRLHLFEEVDNSRPDAPGVSHHEPEAKHYHAAYEIAFANHLEREKFFASSEYAIATKDAAKYIKQIQPFPERASYTFVYDGKLTLAGQRSAKVASLIQSVGATNQLKQDIVSLMNGQIASLIQNVGASNQHQEDVVSLMPSQVNGKSSSLGHYLQGLQHVGITVNDMTKSLEFYVDVLGGKPAIGGDGFIGDELHNLLFQKEDLEAWKQGLNPKTIGVPNIRDGSQEALDVRFISFGNTCVELIHFRDAHLDYKAPNCIGKIPSGIGFVNAPHLSFHVKDNVDLDQFAKMLEDECQKRGLTNVVANRIIHIDSETARKNSPEKYAKLDLIGDFDGWLLFYCKGPSGEQLEFNQVKRKAKEKFSFAQKEYNLSNGTNYWFYNNVAPTNTNNNHRLYGSFSSAVNAPAEKIWQVWLDQAYTEKFNILERYSDGVLREVKMPGMEMKQRITIDQQANTVTINVVDHPLFTGRFINYLYPPQEPSTLPIVTYTIDLQPINATSLEHKDAQGFIEAAKPENVKQAVYQLKAAVENGINTNKEEKSVTQSITRPGTKSEIVRRMFEAGESMNVDNFVKFYTDDAHYQFSNFPVAYGPQGIKETSVGFLQKVAKVYHHITNIWEQGDTVICEMEVTYIRHDGKVFRLPCCDTIVFKGDKVQELRIYMDISPVFQTEEVKPQASLPSGALLERIGKMYEALHAENWDEFMSFFTPNLLYKVGANEPVIGPEACRDFLVNIYKVLKLTTHNARGTWEVGNTVILEMDANYVNKVDKRFIQVPCTDIYRFEGDRIYEWRVYPDPSQLNLKF